LGTVRIKKRRRREEEEKNNHREHRGTEREKRLKKIKQ
jgi:hypothetical protein